MRYTLVFVTQAKLSILDGRHHAIKSITQVTVHGGQGKCLLVGAFTRP